MCYDYEVTFDVISDWTSDCVSDCVAEALEDYGFYNSYSLGFSVETKEAIGSVGACYLDCSGDGNTYSVRVLLSDESSEDHLDIASDVERALSEYGFSGVKALYISSCRL